jgi:acetyltransferase-like isoleucine patch superfamily enzyme
VSGFVDVGASCFLGVNSTISNNIKIGRDCVIGASSTVVGDVPDEQTVVGLWKKPKV